MSVSQVRGHSDSGRQFVGWAEFLIARTTVSGTGLPCQDQGLRLGRRAWGKYGAGWSGVFACQEVVHRRAEPKRSAGVAACNGGSQQLAPRQELCGRDHGAGHRNGVRRGHVM